MARESNEACLNMTVKQHVLFSKGQDKIEAKYQSEIDAVNKEASDKLYNILENKKKDIANLSKEVMAKTDEDIDKEASQEPVPVPV